jgi:hypothetical protein
MAKSSKIQNIKNEAIKKVKIKKKEVWRFRGSNAGSIDIDPLL